MARKIVSHDFFGGMNNKLPDHMIPEGQAKLLRNLFLDKDGVWKDIGAPEMILTIAPGLLTGCVKIVQWFPQTVPADCVDDIVYIVFYSNGNCKLIYRRGAGLWAVPELIDFGTCASGTLHKESYTLFGTEVEADVTVETESSVFLVCLTENGTYTNTLVVSPDAEGNIEQVVWVQYAPFGSGENSEHIRHYIGEDQGYYAVSVEGNTIVGVLEITIAMAGNATANTVDVVWATNKPASSIIYYRKSVDTEWILAVDDASDYTQYHEYTVTGLVANTQYDIYIKSEIASPYEMAEEYLYAAFITQNRIGFYLTQIAIAALAGTHHTPSTGSLSFTASDALVMVLAQIENDYPITNIAIAESASSVHTPSTGAPTTNNQITMIIAITYKSWE